jgi:aminopeptidase N
VAAVPVLTLEEAEERSRLLDVISYRIDLDLARGPETFRSTTALRFRCSRPGADTFVELQAAALHRVALNGVELDPSRLDDNRYPSRTPPPARGCIASSIPRTVRCTSAPTAASMSPSRCMRVSTSRT